MLPNVVPITRAPAAAQPEKRLVLRMLDLWRHARHEEHLPPVGALTVADTGADADYVYTIDCSNDNEARFAHVGAALRVAGWPSDEAALVAACPENSVLGLTSRYWREIVERGVPVTRGGVGRHDGHPVLYRSIMVPLVDQSGKISLIVGAVNWRTVEEQDGTPIE